MNKVRFENSFWGPDFMSTVGYDTLLKRMKEGKTTCNIFESYLKQRAKIEEDYSKALTRICKISSEYTETGTVVDSWDLLRSETERMAVAHLDLATSLSDMEVRLAEFAKKQKNDRKIKEEMVMYLSKEKINLYKKTSSVKKNYQDRGFEFEAANNLLNKAKLNQQSIPTKEWDNSVKNAQKAKNELEKSEANYKDLLAKLEELRQTWEREMQDYCNMCELNEESRLKFLHNELWVVSNLISVCCVEVDSTCELVRKELEKVSIRSDLNDFIQKNATGNVKPDPVTFESYKQNFDKNLTSK